MYGKIQELGFTEIIPLIRTSDMSGWCSVFSHPEFFQSSLLGLAAEADGSETDNFLSLLNSFRVHAKVPQHPLFTEMTGNIFCLQRHGGKNSPYGVCYHWGGQEHQWQYM